MAFDRRKFLKVSGLSVLGLWAKSAADALAGEKPGFGITEKLLHLFRKPVGFASADALTAKKWAMVIKVRNCPADCHACIDACDYVHNIPDAEKMPSPRHEIKWIWQDEYKHAFPDQQHEYVEERVKKLPFLLLCNHCDNPPCVRVCPTKATFKREDGIVMMDQHRCIGCRFCMAACPYGSRSFNWVDPRPYIEKQYPEYPIRVRGVVEKCTFCAERLAIGKIPACVEACQNEAKKHGREPALVFGDLEDPESEVRKLLRSHYTIRRKPQLGTGPQIYYIV